MPYTLKNPELLRTQSYINGEWVSGESTYAVINPANGEDIADVTNISLPQLKSAIDDAEVAFKTWRHVAPRTRATILRKWYDLMIENIDDLGAILSLENGKTFAEGKGEIIYASSYFQWYAEEAPRMYGDLIRPTNPNVRIVTERQPIGVCGIITPWNFPAGMITRKVGAALACGCTVVIRPAHLTPLSALALAYLGEIAGIPKGVVNIVTGDHTFTREFGLELCTNPIIKKLTFTGSTGVGKILMNQVSSTLKKCSFELGGNAPFIVFESADVDAAVEGAMVCKFRGTGQTCVCANRFYVHESLYDEFAAKLKDALSKCVVGDGMKPGVTHGPMIHENAVKKVQDHIQDALSKGAKLEYGGHVIKELGPNYHELTLLTDVTQDMKITYDETFGPVAALIKFKTEEEAVRYANKAEVGLAGYMYSKDVTQVFRVAEAIETGMVGVNAGAISDCALPFGGVKESGFGREGSKYGLDDYTVIKSIVIGGIDSLHL